MSSKKAPEVSPREVEAEIALLSGEVRESPQPPSELQSLQSMLLDFLNKQDARQERLFDSLASRMPPPSTIPQRPVVDTACPSRVKPSSKDLYLVSC